MGDGLYSFADKPAEDLSNPFVAALVYSTVAVALLRVLVLAYIALRRRNDRDS